MSSTSTNREIEKLLSIAKNAIDKENYSNAFLNLEKAVSKNKKNPLTWQLLSQACKRLGRIDSAENFGLTALELDPNSYDAWINMSEIYIDRGELDRAKIAIDKACLIKPLNEESMKILANIYLNKKNYQKSLEIFEKIYHMNPKNIFGNWGIGYCLYKLGRIKDSKPFIDNLIESKDSLKFVNLIHGYYVSEIEGQILKSLELFEAELKLDPSSSCAHGVLGRAYASIGMPEKAYFYETKQLEINKTINIYDNFLMHIHYNPNITNSKILEWALEYQNEIYPEFSNLKYTKNNYPNTVWDKQRKNLRVGFVSGDFRKHAIFSWLHGLMGTLKNYNLEIFCYCNNTHDIATSIWKSEVPNWRDIKDLNDETVKEIIKKDSIDVLVDLSGHTALNRLGVFARKPAPVQVSWLGQSSPIGIKNIDYTISDSFLIKPEEDHFYLQKVYRMPNYFAIFQPPEKNIEITTAPFVKNNFITFGCFNNFMKINDEVIKTWIKILQQKPESRLMLKAKVFKDESFKAYIVNKFQQENIDKHRIIFELHDSNKLDYLTAYNKIDIALDPFPLGGGTTSHDLLWMGVPLIALFGERMSARISAGILHNINASELIAYSKDEYIRKAVELANNLDQISYYKKNLRNQYLSSPCCDQNLFASQLASAFHDMWEDIYENIPDE
jgi:predicted O-linked N-acetylglucosamine transferase (SPINDLY family)